MTTHATPGERFDRAAGTEPYKPESRALDPRHVTIQSGWNVRDVTSSEARANIAGIKASILARVNEDPPLPGLIKPIEVRYDYKTGVTTLVDGHCRLIACRELWNEGQHIYVPCKVLQGTDEQLFASSLTSNSGLPLTQWEIGVGCRKLATGYNWSVKRIAAHLCKTVRYVNEAIALSNVSDDAKSLLAAGAATPGAVLHAVAGKDGDSVEALKTRIAERPADPARKQRALPGVPAKATKPKPVARPKKPSAKEQIAKKAPNLLELADAVCRLVLDDDVAIDEVILAAKAYKKARGL
jgi:ParB-like chromosome segregation protein Spo0J